MGYRVWDEKIKDYGESFMFFWCDDGLLWKEKDTASPLRRAQKRYVGEMCAGMMDVKRKAIYEGDKVSKIIDATDINGEATILGAEYEVKFIKTGFFLVNEHETIHLEATDKLKVTGNIHDGE